ncbi:MAG: hydroxymethylglutaryl-CoA synthase, partial [Nanoarchaeota archaeon]|nr:hydroxymethylglutaryl-CoA synthase [Nanoarchaeota archaeon]
LGVSEKSVPGIDEDSVTIAVEAARNALLCSGIDPKTIGAIFFGSESHPYAVKPTGTIVAEAIMAGQDVMIADMEFACKAGTAALQVSLGLVKAAMVKTALAGGIDTAQGAPGDALEYTAAAGGAAFILGTENIVAAINHTLSFVTDTPDFWRREGQKYPSHGGAFTGSPAYFRHIISASKNIMEYCRTKPKDYDHVIFHQPNEKFPMKAAGELGFTKDQIKTGLLVGRIGNTYSASSLLGLAAVLDVAKPGQRILLTSYGSGAGSDSFDITITENIRKIQKTIQKNTKKVEDYIRTKRYVDYAEYSKLTRHYLMR